MQPLKVQQAGLVHVPSWGLASLPFQPQPLESFSRTAVALAESRCHRCISTVVALFLEKLVYMGMSQSRDPSKFPRNHEFSRKAIDSMKASVDIGDLTPCSMRITTVHSDLRYWNPCSSTSARCFVCMLQSCPFSWNWRGLWQQVVPVSK